MAEPSSGVFQKTSVSADGRHRLRKMEPKRAMPRKLMTRAKMHLRRRKRYHHPRCSMSGRQVVPEWIGKAEPLRAPRWRAGG
jgi:hypothetical protein